jgi:hypothetical protein
LLEYYSGIVYARTFLEKFVKESQVTALVFGIIRMPFLEVAGMPIQTDDGQNVDTTTIDRLQAND